MVEEILNSMIILKEEISQDKREGNVEAYFPKNSPVFKGHFPQMPILAGAYQLMLSKQFYEKIRERKFILKKMVKSKFSGIIGPDMVFKLELKQMKEDKGEHRISLKILVEEKTVTAVKMTLQEV